MKKYTLGELIRGLEKLSKPVIERETKEIILRDEEIIFRKQDELEVGQNPDGSTIGEYRSLDYALFKQQLNPLARGKVDLILTGSTKNKLRVVSIGNGEFRLESSDEKWNSLVSKYGRQIGEVSAKWFLEQQKTKHAPQLIERMKQISGI